MCWDWERRECGVHWTRWDSRMEVKGCGPKGKTASRGKRPGTAIGRHDAMDNGASRSADHAQAKELPHVTITRAAPVFARYPSWLVFGRRVGWGSIMSWATRSERHRKPMVGRD